MLTVLHQVLLMSLLSRFFDCSKSHYRDEILIEKPTHTYAIEALNCDVLIDEVCLGSMEQKTAKYMLAYVTTFS